ncbi:hypothetical protein WA026_009161 [Henosepilachna vigintioctopunctata]|uniref:Uncharacterized protein n=1 Tax=Henosepilachna vigintioctopunctata TaxID=420089 RepID=A0AAW1UZC8_9CUCU
MVGVNSTQEEALSDNDKEDEPTPILSHAQALSAVNDLRSYVTSLHQSEDALQNLNYLEILGVGSTLGVFYGPQACGYKNYPLENLVSFRFTLGVDLNHQNLIYR